MTPVTVLTGFLGSGKTTLLSRLIRHPDMARTAVIINEFGAVGLDHILLESSDENIVELNSGCLCCTIRGDLVVTLEDLLKRRHRGDIMDFERIVIETTGLADPAPILHALMTDTALAGAIRLEGVVTTVDAANGAATLDAHSESVKQAAVADRIVLTKTDLADPDQSDLPNRLRTLNPAAPVLFATHGDIAPARLFDTGLYDPSAKTDAVRAWLDASQHSHAGHSHDPNRHDDSIRAHAFTWSQPVHAVALTLFLEILAEHCGPDLLRLKGVVHLVESPDRPAVIHGVQNVIHPIVWLDAWPDDAHDSKFIFITKDLPGPWFETLLEAVNAEVAETIARRNNAIEQT
ncbi:MAG: GTP-binding protein [Rhodospirillaceae bacterium]|jgi:G3E family GTPase|nr:GTP-binding protein [Rhodospirillaceae bacterium]